MTVSDLQIISQAFIEEHRYLETRGPDYIPDLHRIAGRIKRLGRLRDAAFEAEQLDLDEIHNPND